MKNLNITSLRASLIITISVALLGALKLSTLQNTNVSNDAKAEFVQEPSAGFVKESSAEFVESKLLTTEEPLKEIAPKAKLTSIEIKNEIAKLELEIVEQEKTVFYAESTLESTIKPVTEVLADAPVSISKTAPVESVVEQSANQNLEQFTQQGNELSVEQYIQQYMQPKKAPPSYKSASYGSNSSFRNKLANQAERRLQSKVTYDGSYLKIGYPMGDVPSHMGVCTDVIVRAYRGLGIDLQQRVHEDMKRNFSRYPNNWNLSRPDTNIDHRRVPNLMVYFERKGAALPVTNNPIDYVAGDIVTWNLNNGMTHIGIVSHHVSKETGNPLIVHNIGVGPEMTDMLFKHKITGHYNYGGAMPEGFTAR